MHDSIRRRQRLLRTAAQQRTRAKRVALTGETPAGQRIGQSSSSS